jgi:FAD/FMN-containing dehydrogenase
VVNSYGKSHWERLQALREKYDPNGLFHSYMGVQ